MHDVIETLSVSKTGDEALNEDAFVVCDDVIAVFDGETNKEQPVVPAPGRLVVSALADAVRNLPAGCDPETTVKFLQETVAALPEQGSSMAAVGAVLDFQSRRLTRVGDVAVGINGQFHIRRKLLDEVAATSRAALLRARLSAGWTVDVLRAEDPGREMVLPLLKAAKVWRNQPGSAYGFASLDGTFTPSEMIDVFEIPAGAEVVMATDGYCDPLPSLRQSEETLACSIEADPLRIGPPAGTKAVHPSNISFDDRTFVRVKC